MPPRFKFTKEEILKSALGLVSEKGIEALSARNLAERVGCSVKPIFSFFNNMDEVKAEVIAKANEIYNSYIYKYTHSESFPVYKASGMAYIAFAKEQTELFKLLFMRDRTNEEIAENREEIRDILNIIIAQTGFSEDTAYRFHLEMWIFVHGIAVMIATKYICWQYDYVSTVLSDAYLGLLEKFKKEL